MAVVLHLYRRAASVSPCLLRAFQLQPCVRYMMHRPATMQAAAVSDAGAASKAPNADEKYAVGLRWLHWAIAAGVITCATRSFRAARLAPRIGIRHIGALAPSS